MRVIFNHEKTFSINGFTLVTAQAGEVMDLPQDIGRSFVEQNIVEPYKETKPDVEHDPSKKETKPRKKKGRSTKAPETKEEAREVVDETDDIETDEDDDIEVVEE